ncbi:hypothetical protein Y032_0675g1429 [Ancylostoma ceylanicum]|uniref:Uncharacterized protein n=1 Tax=Ancylostoma ceylanicum TaxID=53326 RepID=A0A016WHP4_9BILA|nr:hypothetical protein Y032_0675g1429 [Ancylostoma ceylanicum]
MCILAQSRHSPFFASDRTLRENRTRKSDWLPVQFRERRSRRTPHRDRAARVRFLNPGCFFHLDASVILVAILLRFVGPVSIHLSHPSPENSSISPRCTRTFECCNCDAHMNRPITAQQRTSCQAAHFRAYLKNGALAYPWLQLPQEFPPKWAELNWKGWILAAVD